MKDYVGRSFHELIDGHEATEKFEKFLATALEAGNGPKKFAQILRLHGNLVGIAILSDCVLDWDSIFGRHVAVM